MISRTGDKALLMISIDNRSHQDAFHCATPVYNLLYLESFNLSESTRSELHALYASSNRHSEIWVSKLVSNFQLWLVVFKTQIEYWNTAFIQQWFWDYLSHRGRHDESLVHLMWLADDLTHLPVGKMAAISQTIFWNAFSWMKYIIFWLKFHWSLFLRIQLTIT